MLKQSAIIFVLSLFVFSASVFAAPNGQNQVKKPKVQTNSIQSPRDVASGQRANGDRTAQRNTGLIDTSTGEIVWAKANGNGSSNGMVRR